MSHFLESSVSKWFKILIHFEHRYGFFSDSHPAALASQHHRLATLHSAPLLSIPSSRSIFRRTKSANVKPAPSIQATKSTNRASHLPSQDPLSQALESTRISKWASMLTPLSRDSGGNISQWTIPPSWWEGKRAGGGKYKMFQKRVFKGVPDRWRRAVWGLMMERWAKEEEGRGEKIMGLKELEKLYFVRFVLLDVEATSTDSSYTCSHCCALLQIPIFKSIWTFLALSPATSCSTPAMDKVNELSSTFCMPSVYTATV